MKDCIPLIGQQMQKQVQRFFTAEPLLRFAEVFIEDKLAESLRFGQLTVLHYDMFGGQGEDPYKAAAAVELFILASDILDDIQDQDAPHKPWMQAPLAVALHVATALLTLSQQAMLQSTSNAEKRIALLDMMNEQLMKSANGQMLDILNEMNDEQAYLEVIKQKSAALLQFACMTGVMLAGRPWHPIVAEYSFEIGLAAQIQNDLRDLLRWDDKSDFLQKKRTLLTLYLIEGDAEEDLWIREYFQGSRTVEEVSMNHEIFLEACERTGTILYGSVMSRMHYNRFEELLDDIQEISPWKSTFLHIINPKTT
ncbi:polyprenyl synthetase family protein [Paenibacillus sp. LHD-38]|uniref:polyprenyl synthetase family protein n=1 Tax=Paenibacillus sp. LHD-38 TaxID=3072143 RepID=UPI00280FEAF4|nr:polyprenyl synthetase family protein [Paenibacillus sp. LHD-38]MDQ8738520.1 polyprenyl synthetase family protein [Paenibacillus sp. LHD-38]